jgi:hypothetical protein
MTARRENEESKIQNFHDTDFYDYAFGLWLAQPY